MGKLTQKQHKKIHQSILTYFRENQLDSIAKKFKKEAKVDEDDIENAPNLQRVWDQHQAGELDSGNESDTEESDSEQPSSATPIAQSTPAAKKNGKFGTDYFLWNLGFFHKSHH